MKVLKYIMSVLSVTVLLTVSYAQEDEVRARHYLDQVKENFNRASTAKQKLDIALQPVNRNFIYSQASSMQPQMSSDKANPLSFAICLGDVDLVHKFLSVIPDVNDLKLAAWGYRQPYMPTHMALDPSFPHIKDVPLAHRLAIIDAIGVKGADFKLVDYKASHYTNPPLAAGLLVTPLVVLYQRERGLWRGLCSMVPILFKRGHPLAALI
jgi:hypothetical protein